MLDGAGNAHGDVELRGHNLAGLPHLHVVGHEAGVHGRPGGADGGAELVGNAFEQREILAAAHASAAGDDGPGGGQLRSFRDRQAFAHKAGQARVMDVVQGFDDA